jgi:hypothetical protein
MIRNELGKLSVAVSALICTDAAHAAPVTIDSEQSAAAAVLSAHHFLLDRNDLNNARQLLINVTHPSRAIINTGLSMLDAATTPADLARAGSIDVPCLHGGTLSAQLTRGTVRNLRMSFNGCVLDYSHLHATYNGVAELAFAGNKFAVNTVPSLRLGTATQDFTITTFQSFPPYSDVTDTRSFNLRMVGTIPMTQRSVGFYFTGSFAYEVTGFWDSFTTIVPPDPLYGAPSEHRHRITAEEIITSGYVKLPETSATEWLDDQTWLHSGRFSVYFDNINGWHNINESIDVHGLRIRTKELYAGGRQVTVDGRATLAWDPSRGAGCLNGDYTFKTGTPLREAAGGSNFFQQGEILINGVAQSRYSPPIQPDPSQPWFQQGPVSIVVANVGQFDYVFDWSVQNGLAPIAQCGV